MELALSGIKKAFGAKKVLNDISLSAVSGECIGILGANGSGKSTLLSILSGITCADCGSFTLDGTDLFRQRNLSHYIAYVPQNNPLVEELSAYDNLRLWFTREQIAQALDGGVLDLLGIGAFLKTPVRKMSGGMQKRLSIACAMSKSPPVLLLDEPSSALDLVCKESLYSYYRAFKQRGGIILIVTHDTEELDLCDRCLILKGGVLTPYKYDGDSSRLASLL